MISILWLAGATEYESVSKKKKSGDYRTKEGADLNTKKETGGRTRDRGCFTSHWTLKAHTRCLSLLCGFPVASQPAKHKCTHLWVLTQCFLKYPKFDVVFIFSAFCSCLRAEFIITLLTLK